MNDYNGQDPVDPTGNIKSDSEEVAALDAIAMRESQLRQQLYAQERDRHHVLTRSLIEAIPNAADTLGRLHDALKFEPENVRHSLDDSAIAHQQRLLNTHQATADGGLIFKVAPYDYQWTDRRPFGSPDADKTLGVMSLEVYSGAQSQLGSTWIGTGLGVLFQPRAVSTYVRVAPYLPYSYRWHNDSTLEVARNRGELGVLVHELGSGTIIVDSRVRLWNDGTAWYETHDDAQYDVYSDSTYFFASSNHTYVVWFWFNSSIDFNYNTGVFDFGSSRANNSLGAELGWVIFEQWT